MAVAPDFGSTASRDGAAGVSGDIDDGIEPVTDQIRDINAAGDDLVAALRT